MSVLVRIVMLAACLQGVSAMRINEIMYNPTGTDADHEWVEVYNDGQSIVDLASWRLQENGVNHQLEPTQGDAAISPGGYAVIVTDTTLFAADYPGFAGNVLETSFSLSNTGEALALLDDSLAVQDEVVYDSSLANGNGYSLTWENGTFIESVRLGGTPSEGSEQPNAVPEFSGAAFVLGATLAGAGYAVLRRRMGRG